MVRCRLAVPLFPWLLLWLAACGGGGGRSAPAGDADALSLEPQPEPLDAEQQAHLLRRTQWAIRPDEQRWLATLGLSLWLDRILDPLPEPDVEAEAARHLIYPMNPSGEQLTLWWLTLMTRTRAPLREVMAFFWHDHFATSQVKFSQATTMHLLRNQVQTLRANCLGNARELLRAMVNDPAMQIWLDGVTSTADAPNENLAREFFERFALGLDRGYTPQDIAETARAFTGYRLESGRPGETSRVVFDPFRHDAGAKTVFGHTGPFTIDSIVDLTVAERDVAGFLARRLFEYFCYPSAPDSVVAALAEELRANRYELRPTLKTLLRSRAFFSATARRSLVKSPLEAAVGLLRATDLAFPLSVLDHLLAAQEQRPLQPPNVGGWPEDTAWLTPAGLIGRAGFAHALAVDRVYQAEHGSDIVRLLPHGASTSAAQAVATMAERLGLALAPGEAEVYVDYLNTRTTLVGEELHTAPDPFVASNAEHVSERLRGLLFLLTQHPSYMLR